MAKYKVIHHKKDCISCGACAAVCSDFFKMDEDGVAQLKDATEVEDHWELVIESLDAKTCNQEAADVCPVQVIKVEELKE